MLDIIVQGGPVMMLLALCSVIGCYAVARQLLFLYLNRFQPEALSQRVIHDITTLGKSEAITQLANNKKPVAKIMATVVKYGDDKVAQPLINDLIPTNPTALLTSLITIAPLLGLLGTVLGLIDIFNVLSGGAIDTNQQLSGGIAQALLTTVTGLAISVPLIILATLIDKKTEQFLHRLDQAIAHIIVHINR